MEEGLRWEGLSLCLTGLLPWDYFGLGADRGREGPGYLDEKAGP